MSGSVAYAKYKGKTPPTEDQICHFTFKGMYNSWDMIDICHHLIVQKDTVKQKLQECIQEDDSTGTLFWARLWNKWDWGVIDRFRLCELKLMNVFNTFRHMTCTSYGVGL